MTKNKILSLTAVLLTGVLVGRLSSDIKLSNKTETSAKEPSYMKDPLFSINGEVFSGKDLGDKDKIHVNMYGSEYKRRMSLLAKEVLFRLSQGGQVDITSLSSQEIREKLRDLPLRHEVINASISDSDVKAYIEKNPALVQQHQDPVYIESLVRRHLSSSQTKDLIQEFLKTISDDVQVMVDF
jgi:hypothetical protein